MENTTEWNYTLYNTTTETAASFSKLNITGWQDKHFPFNPSTIQSVLQTSIIPALCIFGIVGNIINLIVIRRVQQYKLDSAAAKENAANTGLSALAVSDTLFCMCVFPLVFTEQDQLLFPKRSFLLYYQVYGTGLVTTFILTSTWVTITLAVLRYFAICHPFSRFNIKSQPCTVKIYSVVFICSIIVNIPKFFQFKITTIPYTNDRDIFLVDVQNGRFSDIFQWIHFCLFILLPALILLFCNLSLVLVLRRSRKMRKEMMRLSTSSNCISRGQNRVTLLLVVIALTFIALVFPCELMDFFVYYVQTDLKRTEIFLIVRMVANVLQMMNFSCNFLMYCALNVHFRTALMDLIFRRKPSSQRSSLRDQYNQDQVMFLKKTPDKGLENEGV